LKWYGKYEREASWIAIRYGKYGRTSQLNSEKIWKIQKKIVNWYEKYGGKVGWIVKWYGKYGRKVGWIVKR
jgi:hypothetical protein